MKLDEVVNKAEDLYELALKKIDNNETESANNILQTVVTYYSKCIEKRSNFITLYYKRALANKLLNNKFAYFMDIFISSTSGYKDAKNTYNDIVFQSDNKNFINEEFILIFDLTYEDFIKEFSCLILDSKGFLQEKINLKIKTKYVDYDDNEINLNDTQHTYQNIFSVFYHRLRLCETIISNNLNLNKDIIKKELDAQIIGELFKAKNNISIMEKTLKAFNVPKNNLNNSEVYNLLFSKNIPHSKDSEINTILMSDNYRELKSKKLL